MITKIKNSTDAINALNENLEGLLTGKRKLLMAKEVNNTVGKVTNIVKMELMQKMVTGDKTPLAWFTNEKQKFIE